MNQKQQLDVCIYLIKNTKSAAAGNARLADTLGHSHMSSGAI